MRNMKDSGIEWIGEIPEEWEVGKVKDYYKLQTGFTPDTKKQFYYDDEEGYDWVTISDLSNEKFVFDTKNKISQIYIDEKNPEIIPKGSLLYSFKLSVGQVAFAGKDIYSNEAIASFLNNDNCNLKFLYYSSFMIIENANENIYGAKLLNQNLINNAYIIFPPLEEQELIADYLDNKVKEIDNIISKTQETIEEYKKYKQSVITESVTKGLNPNVEMKDSGIEWIGEIPKHWEIQNLNQIFYQLKNKNNDLIEQNLLSLSYGNIVRKDINSKEGLLPENFSGYNIIDKGDIVLRLTDLQNDHTSLRTGLAKERGIITSAYITLRSKESSNTGYFHLYLHSFDIYKGFYGMGSGIRQNLTYDGIKYLKVLVPPLKERQEISDFCNSKIRKIDNLITKKQELITQLESYKKSLIYEYVTGKKEVAVAYGY